MQAELCPVCHRTLVASGEYCCVVRPVADGFAHGVKCRRARMSLAPVEAFSAVEYGQRFRAGWFDEDRRIRQEGAR